MRDIETKAVVEEADIRNMELQLQRKMFEQVKMTVGDGLLCDL